MKTGVYVIAAVILVAVLILVFGGNLTGYSVGECSDSDGGDDPYAGGSISFTKSNIIYKDQCYAAANNPKKFVKEYYCVGESESRRYLCEGGCAENEKGEGYCLEGGASPIKDT